MASPDFSSMDFSDGPPPGFPEGGPMEIPDGAVPPSIAGLMGDAGPPPMTISPLPSLYRHGLIAIAVPAVISLVACVGLAVYLGYLIIVRRRKRLPQNQLAILIFNLMLADIKQTAGYIIELHWLRIDALVGNSGACQAQGWLLSIGNLASAYFAFAIALYTFAFVTFKYQPGAIGFYVTITTSWAAIYAFSLVGVISNPDHWYFPQGPLCILNHRNHDHAVWLHYFWIAASEFLALVFYIILFAVLRIRIRKDVYTQARARKAVVVSRLMFLYPAVYFVCTLPLLAVPILFSTGQIPSFQHLSAGSALWTSIGWLDVIVYTLTRRFEPDDDVMSYASDLESVDPLDTFDPWWFHRPDGRWGTTTIIEAAATHEPSSKRQRKHRKKGVGTSDWSGSSTEALGDGVGGVVGAGREDGKWPIVAVHAHTTVDVVSAPMELDEIYPAYPSKSFADFVNSYGGGGGNGSNGGDQEEGHLEFITQHIADDDTSVKSQNSLAVLPGRRKS